MTLKALGWKPFFAQQVDHDVLSMTPPVRVTEVHKNGLRVLGEGVEMLIPPGPNATVGDWLLLDQEHPPSSRVLERTSLFERRAPGKELRRQMIAANVDTVFIVTSCNQDFNVARLERFVALAFEAEVTPVILLTKVDLCAEADSYFDAARDISNRVSVELVNALSDAAQKVLAPWCAPGQTVAFLGSSGVGKSTLVNAIFAQEMAATAAVRLDDDRGRHTTTSRQLHFTPNGCAVLDTPGMRELQLTDVGAGIADVFEDLTELSHQCKFRDCKHETEPGCAVRAAIKAGDVDADRAARWSKLAEEDRFNSESLLERKAGNKALSKLIRNSQKSRGN
ncbi:MAG: ribosome small subunit-dependent GTPase A [Maritimibacter sp.]